jgi:hypothetical protein
MNMTKQERMDWLNQINRIHEEERRQRFADSESEMEKYMQQMKEQQESNYL